MSDHETYRTEWDGDTQTDEFIFALRLAAMSDALMESILIVTEARIDASHIPRFVMNTSLLAELFPAAIQGFTMGESASDSKKQGYVAWFRKLRIAEPELDVEWSKFDNYETADWYGTLKRIRDRLGAHWDVRTFADGLSNIKSNQIAPDPICRGLRIEGNESQEIRWILPWQAAVHSIFDSTEDFKQFLIELGEVTNGLRLLIDKTCATAFRFSGGLRIVQETDT